jgi:hypothetical protein
MVFRLLTTASLLVALCVAATTSSPAYAAFNHVCIENNQLTFMPPLTESSQSGSVTIAYQGTCPGLPGFTAWDYNGSVTWPYVGTCTAAFIAEGGTSVYAGGVLYGFVRGQTEIKAEAMQPNASCPISSASGSGISTGIY